MSTFWEVIAGIGFLSADLLAVLAAVGTLAILVIAVINVMAKRRILTVPDVFLNWSSAGLALGTLTAIGLSVAPGYDLERMGILFRLSYSTIVTLLAASLVMLVLSIILRRSFRPNYSRVRS
jgi:hypothetical protein